MESYKIQIDVRLFKIPILTTRQIHLLGIIDDYTKHNARFTLRNKDLHQMFNGEITERHIVRLISDLVNKGILIRTRYGFNDHSPYYKKHFVVKRRLQINYDVLDKLLDDYSYDI